MVWNVATGNASISLKHREAVKAANETSNSEDDDDHWPTLVFEPGTSRFQGKTRASVVNGTLDDLRIVCT
jgi:hypothetical protein